MTVQSSSHYQRAVGRRAPLVVFGGFQPPQPNPVYAFVTDAFSVLKRILETAMKSKPTAVT